MSESIHVVDGDWAVDARGKIVTTSGHKKISNQLNYALSTSIYLRSLVLSFKTNSPSANEWALREAILKTVNEVIELHRNNPYLPSNERAKKLTDLQVTRSDATSFEFYVAIETYRGSTFTLNLTKDM